MTPQRVCLLGAESTGKTTLAAQLARALPGLWVPEYLRDFCRLQGRVPRPDEQLHVAQEQMRREVLALAAAQRAGLPAVVCDTAPLMTAIYSRWLFDDDSLLPAALQHHRHYALTLFLQPDIGWQADGLFRDGAHVQQPITRDIDALLRDHALPHVHITGQGDARLDNALQALRAVLSDASTAS